MDKNIMVVGTWIRLSIVPEVQGFVGEWKRRGGGTGEGAQKQQKKCISLVYFTMFRFLGYRKKYIIC